MTRPDPAWLDLQYNNRARLPEHATIFERWATASALARDKASRRIDVAYGPGTNETLDVFPSARAHAPVLVFIHGGWWRSLDKDQHSFVAPSFVDAGAMVVLPNHALCPAVTVQDITLQMVRALVWVYRHAALYGGNPRHIVVAGHSAGGHLAAMLLCCVWKAVARDLPAQLVRSAFSISGVHDLDPVRRAPFLQADLRLTPAAVQRLSPARLPRPRGTLYAAVGAEESEEFQRQTRLIQQAWGRRTVPVCESVPATHHLNVLHELADPSARLHRLALHLLGLGAAPALVA